MQLILNRTLRVATISLGITLSLHSQEASFFSGSIESNANFFILDSTINAFNSPQYLNQHYGGENWITLRYNRDGLSAGIRYDMYINSNVPDPNASYTDRGVGRWYVNKKFEKLEFQAGNLYDQIGSGILYRTYEERPLFIDNSLLGLSAQYYINDDWTVKVFGGQQKNRFDVFGGSMKGIYSDAFFSFGEDLSITVAPGIGFINKTISDESMQRIVNSLQFYLPEDRFGPIYNNYAGSIYNTLSFGGLTLYTEFVLKSRDIYFNPDAIKQELVGQPTFGKYVFEPGSVFYSTLSYTKGKVGITIEGKRTENFVFRSDPTQRLLRGLVSYIPPLNRQNTYRLPARYSPASLEISEQAVQLDVRYNATNKVQLLLNTSNITDLKGLLLYRELFIEAAIKQSAAFKWSGGLQLLQYNQEVYEQKPEVPLVRTVVPFGEFLWKLSQKKSLRVESQYMHTKQDFGSWFYALGELGLAPHWLFELSAMYNSSPKKTLSGSNEPQKILYPTAGIVYTQGPSRLQLRYVKQVEGIVCSGGICRLEPAFSGFRFSLSTQF